MKTPDTNSCITLGKPRYSGLAIEWKERDSGFMHCNYCGSLTPEQMLQFLKTPGTRFSGSDWKYGWPHKFYMTVPNPKADELVEVGSLSGPELDGKHPDDRWRCSAHPFEACQCEKTPSTGRWRRVTFGTNPTLMLKFYNEHLMDSGDLFNELCGAIEKVFQIKFKYRTPQGETTPKLFWSAVRGIQLYGTIGPDLKPVYG